MSGGRIEQSERLRDEKPPDDTVIVIRGGPDTLAKLKKHATRTARAWTMNDEPLEGVSVFCALDDVGKASLDGIMATMASYRIVYLPTVAALRAAGFELLPTATRPHFTLRNNHSGSLEVEQLFEALGEPQANPFHNQTRRGR